VKVDGETKRILAVDTAAVVDDLLTGRIVVARSGNDPLAIMMLKRIAHSALMNLAAAGELAVGEPLMDQLEVSIADITACGVA
jgi:hypothetical protein